MVWTYYWVNDPCWKLKITENNESFTNINTRFFFLFLRHDKRKKEKWGEKNQENIIKITKYYISQLKEYEKNHIPYLKKKKRNMYIQIYTSYQNNRLTSVPKNTVSMFDCCALALSRGELQDLALRPPLQKIQLER